MKGNISNKVVPQMSAFSFGKVIINGIVSRGERLSKMDDSIREILSRREVILQLLGAGV